MKSKWDHEVVNSQEDEDGFSLNPGNVFNYEIAMGSQDIRSNKNSTNTEPGSAEHVMISPGRDGGFRNLFFPLQQTCSPDRY